MSAGVKKSSPSSARAPTTSLAMVLFFTRQGYTVYGLVAIFEVWRAQSVPSEAVAETCRHRVFPGQRVGTFCVYGTNHDDSQVCATASSRSRNCLLAIFGNPWVRGRFWDSRSS